MLFSVLIAVAAVPAPLKVAISELGLVRLDREPGTFMVEALALGLSQPGISVVTSKDIAAVIGLERQRQLLGCNAEGSCLAELASALGADVLIVGDLARIGDGFRAQLKAVRARDATALFNRIVEASTEEQFLKDLGRTGNELAAELLGAFGRGGASTRGGRPLWPWAIAGAGVIAAGTGAALLGIGKGNAAQLSSATSAAPLSRAAAEDLASRGAMLETTGVILLIAGGALAATGVVLGVTLPVSVAPVPGGGGLVLVGAAF